MAYTIGSEPWEYLPLLNECIKILLSVALGIVLAYFKIFDDKNFVPVAVKFVFHVALPLLVLKGLGTIVNFYNERFEWNYIASFLVLRAVALVVSFFWVLVASKWSKEKKGIGQVAVYWLTLTWISTVILGIPISKAVFGSESLGIFYGLLAGVSSFIFQLPLQLLFLECHSLEQEYAESKTEENEASSDETSDEEAQKESNPSLKPDEAAPTLKHDITLNEQESPFTSEDETVPLLLWLKFARQRDVQKKVCVRVLTNPVILGIAGGFFLSLTTIGPRFLNPTSDEYVPGLGWFFAVTTWFGDIVSPLSLFTMGVWMQCQGTKLFQIPMHAAVLSMFSKLVIVPLLMVGLSKAFKLSDEAGRAAVLIAALPISMASFSLGSQYKIGEALLSENVALGTALLLPTILVWNIVMDSIGLFPIN